MKIATERLSAPPFPPNLPDKSFFREWLMERQLLQQTGFRTPLISVTHQPDSFPISENVRKLKGTVLSPGDKSHVRAVITSKYSWPHLEIGCHLGHGLVRSPTQEGRADYQSPRVSHPARPSCRASIVSLGCCHLLLDGRNSTTTCVLDTQLGSFKKRREGNRWGLKLQGPIVYLCTVFFLLLFVLV